MVSVIVGDDVGVDVGDATNGIVLMTRVIYTSLGVGVREDVIVGVGVKV